MKIVEFLRQEIIKREPVIPLKWLRGTIITKLKSFWVHVYVHQHGLFLGRKIRRVIRKVESVVLGKVSSLHIRQET